MTALDFLLTHWLAIALLAVGTLASVPSIRSRRVPWSSGAVAMVGLGGLILPGDWGGWLLSGAAGVLVVMGVVLLLSGHWFRPAAVTAGLVGLLALGSLVSVNLGRSLAEFAAAVRDMEFAQPWWLLLLATLPLVVWLSRRRLDLDRVWRTRRVETWRPWVAVLCRCGLVALLALALAEPRIRRTDENLTVLFVLDRSASIPEQLEDDPRVPGGQVNRRWERVRGFINEAVARRGRGHERDRAGLLVFGRRPRLELPPSDAPLFQLTELNAPIDPGYSDIAAALKLAMASFPEGTGKRIVLISDGNENLGNAEEQARLAATLGVQIDVVPLAAGQRNEEEVLVERVEAPRLIEQGSSVPIRVLVRSFNPNYVLGKLALRQVTEGEVSLVGQPVRVKLAPGLNSFTFQRPVSQEQRSYTYEAEFTPEGIADEDGKLLQKAPLARDRVQNNRAATHVIAKGRRRILILEGEAGTHKELIDKLVAAGRNKFSVVAEPAAILDRYPDPDQLGVFLSNFDCLILANVPADQVSEKQREVIRSNTHDQGCGLVMIGGPESFGAGGWQNTAVEKALPVDADIRSLKVEGKGGLVLIMHASEMADGNMWQKKIAKLAIERLGPSDEVGVIDFGGQCRWHIPLQEVGDKQAKLLELVGRLVPGDMPDFDPALAMAFDALTKRPDKEPLSTKHVIIISDGDPICTLANLATFRRSKVTVTTVGVACHGANEDQKMADIARATGGRPYSVKNPSQLPAIYIKETRLVSQAFVHEDPKGFRPQVLIRSGPTDRLPDALAPITGFVRTTPKQSPLVEIPILSPRISGQDFPLLAYWHYGLGKAVAFTSDAGRHGGEEPFQRFWARSWPESGVYGPFWEQVVEWSLRPSESQRLLIATEARDGKIRVVVEARDDQGKPDTSLRLRGGITGPGGADARKRELRFVQKNSGVYELEVQAEESGSYFLNAQATRVVVKRDKDGNPVRDKDGNVVEIEEGIDGVRAGITLPYSAEYSDLESNAGLMERIRDLTGGKTYEDTDASLRGAAQSGDVFRPGLPRSRSLLPLWQWLLLFAGILLLVDVAVRRVALDAGQIRAGAEKVWARLRGQAVREEGQESFLDRLRSRKEAAGAGMERKKAAKRFEATGPTADVPTADTAPPPVSRPAASKPAPPSQPEAPPEDYAARLLRAKKKALEDRDKDKS